MEHPINELLFREEMFLPVDNIQKQAAKEILDLFNIETEALNKFPLSRIRIYSGVCFQIRLVKRSSYPVNIIRTFLTAILVYIIFKFQAGKK